MNVTSSRYGCYFNPVLFSDGKLYYFGSKKNEIKTKALRNFCKVFKYKFQLKYHFTTNYFGFCVAFVLKNETTTQKLYREKEVVVKLYVKRNSQ